MLPSSSVILLSVILTADPAPSPLAPVGSDRAAPCALPAPPAPDFVALAGAAFTFTPTTQDGPMHAASTQIAATQPGADSAGAPPADAPPALDAAHDNRYFQRDSWRWQVTAAAASDFQDDNFALAGLSASYFLEEDLTVDFELNGLYLDQDDGDNTAGVNFTLLFRWHFAIDDARRWSLFADAGFGLLFTIDDVPGTGEDFNFTPQLGAGFSLLLDEQSDARLLAGVRWHHISNANIFEENPGTDRLMLYAGLNFPF